MQPKALRLRYKHVPDDAPTLKGIGGDTFAPSFEKWTLLARPQYRRRVIPVAAIVLMGAVAAGCAGDPEAVPSTGKSEQSSAEKSEESPAPEESSLDGVLVADEATRFFEYDWTVVGVERRPDGPDDDGEDVDPTEDFLYVDLEVSSPLGEGSFGIPPDFVTLVVDGEGLRPTEATDSGSGDSLSYVDVSPNRAEAVTVVFTIDAEASLEGAFVELDQNGYLPAATAGPQFVDQSERVAASFETTSYSGPFSRDEAEVEVIESFWSRELGTDDTNKLIESPDYSSRRPPLGHMWLIVHFEVTCLRISIDTGGCNVLGGQVMVDGDRANGSNLNDGVDYGETQAFWAAYPVPVDASAVTVEISDLRTADAGSKTSFVVADLEPLKRMATQG